MNHDTHQIALILLDAFALGDGPAARRGGVSRRTVERYRARVKTDPELAALVATMRAESEAELAVIRVRFLRNALASMERKVKLRRTTVAEIAEAVKVVGELHLTSEAMGDAVDSCPDPEPDEAARGDSDAAHGPH